MEQASAAIPARLKSAEVDSILTCDALLSCSDWLMIFGSVAGVYHCQHTEKQEEGERQPVDVVKCFVLLSY